MKETLHLKLWQFIIVTCFILSPKLEAQVDYDWGNAIGSKSNEYATAIAVDNNNDVIIAGDLSDTIYFNPATGNPYEYGVAAPDMFIAKYSSTGSCLWSIKVEAVKNPPMPMYVEDLAVDANNNVYVTGFFAGTADFDPSSNSDSVSAVGTFSAFVAKYSSTGAYQWAFSIGGPIVDFGRSIAIDNNGDVIIGGYVFFTADFDPSPSGTYNLSTYGNSPDMYLAKYSSSGALIWAGHAGSHSTMDEISEISIDNANNIYVTGTFGDTANFDLQGGTYDVVSTGSQDAFVAKYNANGVLQWVKSYGGSGNDAGTGIEVDNAGNIFASGYIADTTTFSTTFGNEIINTKGSDDCVLIKYDNNGNAKWVTSFGGIDEDRPTNISLDSNSNIYLGGYFSADIDFLSPKISALTKTSAGMKDGFVASFDSAGAYAWGRIMGGASNDEIRDIAIKGNSLYTTGYFNTTADLDISASSNIANSVGGSNDDIFVVKYDLVCTGSAFFPANKTLCNGSSYVFGSQNISTSGMYQEVFTTGNGCDSIVDLTVDTDSIYATATLNSIELYADTVQGATYQWVDCTSGQAIPNATSWMFTASQNGSYSVVVSNGACSDTSTCKTVTEVGMYQNTQPRVTVYPNPSNGTFTIVSPSRCAYYITNTAGQRIGQGSLDKGENRIKLNTLPRGFYIIVSEEGQFAPEVIQIEH